MPDESGLRLSESSSSSFLKDQLSVQPGVCANGNEGRLVAKLIVVRRSKRGVIRRYLVKLSDGCLRVWEYMLRGSYFSPVILASVTGLCVARLARGFCWRI